MKNPTKKLIFITGNKEKIAIARAALEATSIIIEAKNIDCVEIQSDEIAEIAKTAAKYSSGMLKADVVKVDTGLFIEALNGFPGPYSSYVERHLTAKQILRMMSGEKNRKAVYREALAYCEAGCEPVVFTASTEGEIATRASGKFGWNFDRIFIANEDTMTLAHFPDEKRIGKYSEANWKSLVAYIASKKRGLFFEDRGGDEKEDCDEDDGAATGEVEVVGEE